MWLTLLRHRDRRGSNERHPRLGNVEGLPEGLRVRGASRGGAPRAGSRVRRRGRVRRREICQLLPGESACVRWFSPSCCLSRFVFYFIIIFFGGLGGVLVCVCLPLPTPRFLPCLFLEYIVLLSNSYITPIRGLFPCLVFSSTAN